MVKTEARARIAPQQTTPAGATAQRDGCRLGLWRLEWLRLCRTRTLLLIMLAYPGVAVVAPFAARNWNAILDAFGMDSATRLVSADGVDGMNAYLMASSQIGGLVCLGVMSAALTFDHQPGKAAFYRTRVRRPRDLLLPRWAAVTGAVAVASFLGSCIAWAGTHFLLGPVPTGRVLAGMAFDQIINLCGMALVAGVAAVLRRPVAVFGTTLALLISQPLLGLWRPLRDHLPADLGDASARIIKGESPGEFAVAAITAAIATVLLLTFAVRRIGQREM